MRFKSWVLLLLCALLGLFSQAAAEGALLSGELQREGLPFAASYPDNPLIPGESPVTGRPASGVYAPVIMVIDNSRAAHPHWGVQNADIIYQVPNAGGGATKLLALFSDQLPEAAGGSRSARSPFVDVARGWGAAFVYAGHANLKSNNKASVSERLKDAGMRYRVLAFNLLSNNNFSERIRGYVSPHNLSVKVRKVQELALENGASFTPRPFRFSDTLPEGYPQVPSFSVRHYGMTVASGNGNKDSYALFSYDPAQKGYLRFTSAGPYIDRDLPDSPLVFSNVIVQRARFTHSEAYVLLEGLAGTGAADIFIGGQYIRGGWYRENLDSRTVFVDENGQEIALQRGRTFIILTNQISAVVPE